MRGVVSLLLSGSPGKGSGCRAQIAYKPLRTRPLVVFWRITEAPLGPILIIRLSWDRDSGTAATSKAAKEALCMHQFRKPFLARSSQVSGDSKGSSPESIHGRATFKTFGRCGACQQHVTQFSRPGLSEPSTLNPSCLCLRLLSGLWFPVWVRL